MEASGDLIHNLKKVDTLHLKDIQKEEQICDIFVVYDESDDFARDEVLTTLESEQILFCCMERHGNPGSTIFEDYQNLIRQSKKVMFVISKHFNLNEELVFMATMAFDILEHDGQKIITLITDGIISPRSGLYCLNSTAKYSIRQKEWKKDIIRAIQSVPLDFCSLLENGNVSDYLLLRGLCLLHLRLDIYGLLLVAKNRYLKVDLVEYSKHLDVHHKINTSKACEQCGFLCSINTTINLSFCKEFSENKIVDIKEDITKLCVGLLKTCCDKEWLIVCSVSGLFEKEEQRYVSELYAETKFAVETHHTTEYRRDGKIHLPDYTDEQKRMETFPVVWNNKSGPPEEVMAKSGFVYMMTPCLVQCFSCGYYMGRCDFDQNPLILHAQTTPGCKFVRENLPAELMPTMKMKFIAKNDAYAAEEIRLLSLQSLKHI